MTKDNWPADKWGTIPPANVRIDREAILLSGESLSSTLLERNPAVRVADRRLRPRRREEDEAFLAALAGLPIGGRQIVTLRTREGAPVLLIKLWAEEQAVVLARIVDLLMPAPPDMSLVAHALSLTRMEARVAALLSTGLDVEEMAERLDIMPATVRSHLKRAMRKTGCRSQTRLALMVVRAMS